MNAHRLVIAAAALTVAVAAALAATLATFSSQALPRAVRHDLGHATGTSMVIRGNVNAGQSAQYTSLLPGKISTALDGTPFAFYHAYWSDPLGFVPGSRPVPPSGTRTVQIAEAAALDGITARAQLVAGHWPGALPGDGGPIPAALPASAAALLHVAAGDVLQLRDRVSGQRVRFVVTGLYRPRQVTAAYWSLDDVGLDGQSTLSGFTTYGPLTVPAAAFRGPLTVDAGSWLAVPHTTSVPAGQLRTVAANVADLRQGLAGAVQLPDLTTVTELPAVLNGTASKRDVARSLLAICAVLLALLAAAALLAVARLLTGQREGESAMLVARGATRWQLIRMSAAEAVPLCLLCAAAGGLAGTGLARLLAGPGSAGWDGAGRDGAGWDGAGWPAVLAAAVVGAGALVILLLPVLSTVTPGTARARRGRQAAIAGVTRAGADLALIVLAVVAGYQLRHYSAVSAGASGNFGVNPVVVAAPALALAGGTVLALRLLPAGGKAGDLLAARGRRLTAAMASWQISRQPIRQGGAALLIVLAVATGTLGLSQRQSWTQSIHDQAAFSAGSDVRVQTSQPLSAAQAGQLARAPGVQRAMPVASFPRTDTDAVTLAVDATQAARLVRLRSDESSLPAGQLFGKIQPRGPPPGVTLPGPLDQGAAFRLTARLGPAALHLGSAQVTVSVEDKDSAVYQFDAGSLPADGQDHVLTVDLGSSTAIYPLRLSMVNLDYTLPAARPQGPAVFTLDGVSGPSGRLAGTALRNWAVTASSTELQGVKQDQGTAGPSASPSFSSAASAGSALAVTFQPGYGLAASGIFGAPPTTVDGQLALTPSAPGVIPGLATQRFLAISHANVGATVQTNLDGAIVIVRIVAAVSTFPTVSGNGGGLIVDLGTLQAVLARGLVVPAPVTQWWLTVSGPRPGLPAGTLPPGSAVTSASGIEAGLLADPLSTVPQQALLAVALAAAVLAITGFCVSIAAGVRQRRAENALLAALGVPPRSAAAQLCLEKLMLSVPSAVAGLILGAVLAELLVPAITLTSAAAAPVPPVLIQLGWSQILPLALAVAVLPVLAAGLTIARRPDAAAELRAAEST
ncbi:MAG TPA: ABC transporter permease [Streptosporangiaceae bacterium]|nr:ABC transporter permease [Streptosporangiaceae bacterium]